MILKKTKNSSLEIINYLWDKKFVILSVTILSAVFSVTYSLNLEDIYKSEAIVTAVEDSDKSPISGRSLGGFASIAGINMSQSSANKSQEGIQILQSFYFFSLFLDSHNYLPEIMAAKSWDQATNIIQYDKKIYNNELDKWVRKVNSPKRSEPSYQEAYLEFKKIFNVSQDTDTGFVTITVEHVSPFIANDMVVQIIDLLNEIIRDKDRAKATRSLDFLNSQISNTTLAEMRLALANLIKQETQTLMLVEANNEYLFKVIDPSVASEIKSKPNRAYLCILYTFLGFMLSVFILLASFFLKTSNKDL